MTTTSLIGALAALLLALPCLAQSKEPTPEALKVQALTQSLAYRRAHLREMPVHACSVWTVLGEDSRAVHPAYRSLFQGNVRAGCPGMSSREPLFRVLSIQQQGPRVIVSAQVDEAGEKFTEIHTLVSMRQADGSAGFYHESVVHSDFVHTSPVPSVPRGYSRPAKPPASRR